MIKIIIIVDVVVVSTKNFEWYAQSSKFSNTVRSSVCVCVCAQRIEYVPSTVKKIEENRNEHKSFHNNSWMHFDKSNSCYQGYTAHTLCRSVHFSSLLSYYPIEFIKLRKYLSKRICAGFGCCTAGHWDKGVFTWALLLILHCVGAVYWWHRCYLLGVASCSSPLFYVNQFVRLHDDNSNEWRMQLCASAQFP